MAPTDDVTMIDDLDGPADPDVHAQLLEAVRAAGLTVDPGDDGRIVVRNALGEIVGGGSSTIRPLSALERAAVDRARQLRTIGDIGAELAVLNGQKAELLDRLFAAAAEVYDDGMSWPEIYQAFVATAGDKVEPTAAQLYDAASKLTKVRPKQQRGPRPRRPTPPTGQGALGV